MTTQQAHIRIPVDLTNPGQFFACCGLLELSERIWPGSEGWFDDQHFYLGSNDEQNFDNLLRSLKQMTVGNSMSPVKVARLRELCGIPKKTLTKELEAEKKSLESQRREEPIVLTGPIPLRIDWFRDEFAGGSRFKTWAGQQSVLEIATAMHGGIANAEDTSESTLFESARGIGLPFNFDSDLGGQGTALDIGFSFDPLASSEATRIVGSSRPALEFLCFVGLQRFRPREIRGQNRFIYSGWRTPLAPTVASAVVAQSMPLSNRLSFEFRLLYRTKYLKSFLPASPFQGETNDEN